MSLKTGLVRAGRSLDSPRKSLGPIRQVLTLDSPEGWLTGDDPAGMSRDRAMKISTVNRCVEVLSNSMAVLPVFVMNERTKERVPDHRLGPVLWGRPNEAISGTLCWYPPISQRFRWKTHALTGQRSTWTCR